MTMQTTTERTYGYLNHGPSFRAIGQAFARHHAIENCITGYTSLCGEARRFLCAALTCIGYASTETCCGMDTRRNRVPMSDVLDRVNHYLAEADEYMDQAEEAIRALNIGDLTREMNWLRYVPSPRA